MKNAGLVIASAALGILAGFLIIDAGAAEVRGTERNMSKDELMAWGSQLTDGQVTITVTASYTGPSGQPPHYPQTPGWPLLGTVTAGGTTLSIVCECPVSVSGPCYAVYYWDAAGKSYKGTNINCVGGTNTIHAMVFDTANGGYMESVQVGQRFHVVGQGTHTQP